TGNRRCRRGALELGAGPALPVAGCLFPVPCSLFPVPGPRGQEICALDADPDRLRRMKLRHAADHRTLLWAFLFFSAVALSQYAFPALAGWLLPLGIYFGYCAAIFSHNHNHCPTFTSRRANAFFSAWISVFYGYPTFAWIP